MKIRKFFERVVDSMIRGIHARHGMILPDRQSASDLTPPPDLMIEETSMTLFDQVRVRWPNAPDEACDEILWLTPFPCVDVATVLKALDDLRAKYGPRIGDAIKGEYRSLDQQFAEYRKLHPEDFETPQ